MPEKTLDNFCVFAVVDDFPTSKLILEIEFLSWLDRSIEWNMIVDSAVKQNYEVVEIIEIYH